MLLHRASKTCRQVKTWARECRHPRPGPRRLARPRHIRLINRRRSRSRPCRQCPIPRMCWRGRRRWCRSCRRRRPGPVGSKKQDKRYILKLTANDKNPIYIYMWTHHHHHPKNNKTNNNTTIPLDLIWELPFFLPISCSFFLDINNYTKHTH